MDAIQSGTAYLALTAETSKSGCTGLCHDRAVSPASTAKPKEKRVRLDQLLVERGLVETRSRAQALVLAGKVRVGEGDAARHDRKPGSHMSAAAATSWRRRSTRS